jgi:hypothetical protein
MTVADQSAARLTRRVPRTVRLTPQFVNRIRDQLRTHNFNTDPQIRLHGFLFGTIDSHLVTVQAFRSLLRDELRAITSQSDTRISAAFLRINAAAKRDPELSSYKMIGWFCFSLHPGLQERDVEFHNGYFHRASDIALVLKPEQNSEFLAEFYTRSLNASLSSQDYRWGSLRLPTDQVVAGSIDVTIQARMTDSIYLRAYHGVGSPPAAAPRRKLLSRLKLGSRKIADHDRLLNAARNQSADLAITSRRQPASRATATKGSGVDNPFPRAGKVPGSSRIRNTPRIFDLDLGAAEPDYDFPVAAGTPPTVPALIPPKRERGPWLSSIAIFLAVATTTALVLLIGVPRLFNVRPLATLVQQGFRESGLGLRTTSQGNGVLLTWNRQNPVVLSAERGVLHINDGSRQRHILLDPGQITGGAVLYRSLSGDVTFRLEVHGAGGKTISETTSVLDGGKPDGVSPETPEPSSGTASDPTPNTRETHLLAKATTEQNQTPAQPVAAEERTQSPAHVNGPSNDSAGEGTPASSYLPARAVRLILPDVASLDPAALLRVSDVKIEVSVDDTGRVTDARSAKESASINQAVISQAIKAAKQWRYEPAKFQDHNVASNEIIIFQFHPGQ